MSAPLKLIDGIVTLPSLTFNSESSSGLFRPSSGQIGVVASGVEVLRVKSNGAVMIGTSTDLGAKFNVLGTSQLQGAVTITGATSVTGDVSMSSQNGGQLAGMRNRIINGDMRIDQRNSGAAVTITSTGIQYALDRFFGFTGATPSRFSIQQVLDAPSGFKYSTKITTLTQSASAAGDQLLFGQFIEGQNLIDLGFGTATPSQITVSFWVKGSAAGTYSASFRNSAVTRSFVFTVPVTTAWVKQSVSLTADATGTWATDNTTGLSLFFDLGSGTTYTGTAGSWQAANIQRTAGSVQLVSQVVGATLNITGVQLELGTVATPFEQRPIGLEQMLCERYLPTWIVPSSGYSFAGQCFATTSAVITLPMRTRTRVLPTGVIYSSASIQVVQSNGTAVGSGNLTFLSASTDTICVQPTGAAGLVAGNVTMLISAGSNSIIYGTGCEL